MKFVVDCMLGKLAKWLLILGFDVVYFRKIEDQKLAYLALKEDRILLTRDNGLMEKAKGIKCLFIKSETWRQQVKQVLNELDLWAHVKPYSRCIECNLPLKNLKKKEARNLVAPFIYERSVSFAICPCCGRVFWKGTHYDDMEFRISEILKKTKTDKKNEGKKIIS